MPGTDGYMTLGGRRSVQAMQLLCLDSMALSDNRWLKGKKILSRTHTNMPLNTHVHKLAGEARRSIYQRTRTHIRAGASSNLL